ncbi:MAG: SPFH domain-containing protein, partial [Pseudoclavibacter sp.]
MDFIQDNVTVIAVLAIVIALVAVVIFISSRIRRVPPNEALIVVGRGAGQGATADLTGQRVVIGGRTFVWPILQQGFPISLEQRQIGINVEGVDKNRIKIAIKSSIYFKVSGTEDCVLRSGQRFLD